jgi:asparagine synthetase B (glutamine-hydrolysing)
MLNSYLKYGWVWNFKYPDPPAIAEEKRYLVEFADSLNKIYKRKTRYLHTQYDKPLFMLSGGVDSSLIVAYLKGRDINTISVPNWNIGDIPFTEYVSEKFNTNHTTLLTKNEFGIDDLIAMQKFFEYPHSRLMALFWYMIGKGMKEAEIDCDIVVTGCGPDHYMLEDVNGYMITKAIAMKQYDLGLAARYKRQIRDEFKSSVYKLGTFQGESYKDLFEWNQFPVSFQDDEVKELGLEPYDLELRHEGIKHMDNLLCTAKDTAYKLYFKMVEEIFGYKFDDSVFTNDSAINQYIKIPIEAKNCLGLSKPIIRKIASDYLPEIISKRDKLDWEWDAERLSSMLLVGDEYFSYPIKFESIKELVDTFLMNKNLKIYNHLDYDKAKKHFHGFTTSRLAAKLWSLLNLSCWLEVKDEN